MTQQPNYLINQNIGKSDDQTKIGAANQPYINQTN